MQQKKKKKKEKVPLKVCKRGHPPHFLQGSDTILAGLSGSRMIAVLERLCVLRVDVGQPMGKQAPCCTHFSCKSKNLCSVFFSKFFQVQALMVEVELHNCLKRADNPAARASVIAIKLYLYYLWNVQIQGKMYL